MIIDDYMNIIGNENNSSAAIYICFCGLFRLKGMNSVKLTFYIVNERKTRSEGTHQLVTFMQISSHISGKRC